MMSYYVDFGCEEVEGAENLHEDFDEPFRPLGCDFFDVGQGGIERAAETGHVRSIATVATGRVDGHEGRIGG